MTLIKIKNRTVLTLPILMRYALRHIYEPKTMSTNEIDLMERSIVSWNMNVNLTEDEKETLEKIGWGLQKDTEGYFDERKRTFKEHGIIWQKFHRLSEWGPYAF